MSLINPITTVSTQAIVANIGVSDNINESVDSVTVIDLTVAGTLFRTKLLDNGVELAEPEANELFMAIVEVLIYYTNETDSSKVITDSEAKLIAGMLVHELDYAIYSNITNDMSPTSDTIYEVMLIVLDLGILNAVNDSRVNGITRIPLGWTDATHMLLLHVTDKERGEELDK